MGTIVEHHSRIEPWVIRHVCEPALRLVPESVHPNTLSAWNHVAAWAAFLAAAVSPHFTPGLRVGVLAFAGAAMFTSMVLDNLDGMQARRTGKTSRFGEFLDHWLDALHTPFVSGAFVLLVGPPVWAVAIIHVTATTIYHAQVLLHHHTGRFVHTPMSGSDAQLVAAVAYPVFGVFFWLFPRELGWVSSLVSALCLVAIALQIRPNVFYYVRLKKLIVWHLPFVALLAACGALHVAGAIDRVAFVALVIAVSFRVSGSYVLWSILKKPYSGLDVASAVAVAAVAGVWAFVPPRVVGPWALAAVMPWAASIALTAMNLAGVARQWRALRGA